MTRRIGLLLALLVLVSFFVAEVSSCLAATRQDPGDIKIVRHLLYSVDEDDIFIPQISGMGDATLQTRINKEIEQFVLSLRNPSPESSLKGDFEVSFYNGNLLGIHLWCFSYTRGAAHPNKFDTGIHVDLNTGQVYSLVDLFKAGTDYNSRIKELCFHNETSYRLRNNNHWADCIEDDWTYEAPFACYWPSQGEFLLRADSIRVYVSDAVCGAISGYSVPYSDLMDIIDTDSSLWKAISSRGSSAIAVESEALTADDFIIKGIRLGDSAASVVQRLGQPVSTTQIRDGISYDYDDIQVVIGTRNTVVNIITGEWKPGQQFGFIATHKGICPGYSLMEVTRRYGTDSTVTHFADYDLYEYSFNADSHQQYILRFAVKQGTDTVSYIGSRISER